MKTVQLLEVAQGKVNMAEAIIKNAENRMKELSAIAKTKRTADNHAEFAQCESTVKEANEELAAATAEVTRLAEMLSNGENGEDESTGVAVAGEGLKDVHEMFDDLEGADISELINDDIVYLKLELGTTHNVIFTGRVMKLPNKIARKQDPNSTATIDAVCGYFRKENKEIAAFCNSDVMIMRKVAEWVGNGKLTPETPMKCRMIVSPKLSGEIGKQFKQITFLVDNI